MYVFTVLDTTLNNNVYLSVIELVLIVRFVLTLLLVAVVVTKLPKCPLPLTKQPLNRALCCPTETEVVFLVTGRNILSVSLSIIAFVYLFFLEFLWAKRIFCSNSWKRVWPESGLASGAGRFINTRPAVRTVRRQKTRGLRPLTQEFTNKYPTR